MFGLSVTGMVSIRGLKQNCTAKAGDLLYLTKPIGVGVISAAQKRGKALLADHARAVDQMKCLNSFGKSMSPLSGVTAMTDVTGFGLLGHLIEVCEGSGVSATIQYSDVPLIENLKFYLDQFIYPDMTMRNFNAYSSKTCPLNGEQLFTLCDPQTSGGLLICVRPESEQQLIELARTENQALWKIGNLTERKEKVVYIS
jgi:selenide,water dikinase